MIALLALACVPPAPEAVRVVAGAGDAGFYGDGGPATRAMLYLPTDVARLPTGELLIVDWNNHRLRAIDALGRIRTVAGNGWHGYATPGLPATDSAFENPIAAAVGPDGLVTLAAQHEGRVLRIAADGRVEVVAGTGTIGFSGDGGPATAAELADPTDVAFDRDGALYIADDVNHRVRRVDPVTGVIDTVIGTGVEGPPGEGLGTETAVSWPQNVLWDDTHDRLLVADTHGHRVCAWDRGTGIVTNVVGTGVAGYDGDGGPATDAALDTPRGLAVAPDGTLYVADSGNDVIRAVSPDGVVETVLAAPVHGPAGLWLDDGGLYIANQLEHQVIVWDPSASP